MNIQHIFESYSKAFINCEDQISFHQAFYRLFALNDGNHFVLHGSAVRYKNKTILFGDDGLSIGKTTASLMLDGEYIADEFVVYYNGTIYPNRFFKPYDKHLGFVEPKKWLNNPVKLDLIVCPSIGDNSISELKGDLKQKALNSTAYAHLIKLKHPGTDRYSIITGSKNKHPIDIGKYLNNYKNFECDIPAYKMTFRKDSNISNLLKGVLW